MRTVFFLFLMIILISISPAFAFETRSGGNIVIDTPINDDLLASGEMMTVNAPVKSITWMGGSLIVNAPVETNIIAAGKDITVNSSVGTDLIAAGGTVSVDGDVKGKILATGGSVGVNCPADNLIASGGTVKLGENAVIKRDAKISASRYDTKGSIGGRLDVQGVKGTTEEHAFNFNALIALIKTIILILKVLITIGMAILGLVLIRLLPGSWDSTVRILKEKTAISMATGIILLIAAGLLIIVLTITMVGIPIALILTLVLMIAIILSGLVVSSGIGSYIAKAMKREISPYITFIIGFIILQILFAIPFIGLIIEILVIILGCGALTQAVKEYQYQETPKCN